MKNNQNIDKLIEKNYNKAHSKVTLHHLKENIIKLFFITHVSLLHYAADVNNMCNLYYNKLCLYL